MLYDARGQVIKFAKEKPPKLGDQFAPWNDRTSIFTLPMPGGSFVQFDVNKLTLADFRQMSTHYQINSSLNLLAFMQHQAKWKVVHPDKKVRDLLTENLEQIWTQLIRARSQANWAGYAPSVIEWDNYMYDHSVRITKVKDLLPEECLVHWKEIALWAPPGQVPPKEKIYDGIDKYGSRFPIPKEATFWYTLLKPNGDFYGRKLLKAVYSSYFFSMLLHLYANRYFERFGEPTPIGRAPFDDDIVIQGQTISGSELMLNMLQNLRSRGVVLLPSDKVVDGNGASHFDYDIEFLDNQMKGADFERMLTRYDQEMSLGTFTPLLLQQTADVGSYNLGGLHYQMYLLTQNAMNADFAEYVSKYIFMPLIRYNFSKSTVPARLEFEKQDNEKQKLIEMIIQAMLNKGTLGVDVDEIGQAAGLTLKQIKALKTPTVTPPPGNPNNDSGEGGNQNDPTGTGDSNTGPIPSGETGNPSRNSRQRLREEILDRVRGQVYNAMKAGTFGPETEINIPFGKQLAKEYPDLAMQTYLESWCVMATNQSWPSAEHFRAGLHIAWQIAEQVHD